MSAGKISRRGFMERSAGAAGAALAARAVRLDGSPIPAAGLPVAASDTVRFGIIGVGMRGSDLLATSIKLPGVECAAACDLYDGRVELAKEIIGKDAVTTKRYQDLLDNKEIDCLIVPVPDHCHHRVVMDALRAGKDVYVEKPMTHKVEEGFDIVAAARKHNRVVQVGSQEPSSVIYQKAKELLAQNVLGRLSLIEAVMGRNEPCGAWEYTVPPDLSPQTMNWDTWLGPAPKVPFNGTRWAQWRGYQDYGEGIPGDLFVHHLTGIHYALGVTDPPRRAVSQGGLYRWKDGRDQPDVITTLYDYPGFNLTLRVTLDTGTDSGFRLMGDRGIMTIEGVENPTGFSIWPEDGMNHGPCTPGWPRKMRMDYAAQWHAKHDTAPGEADAIESSAYYAPPQYNSTREHLWNFFQSVKTRRPSVEDAEFGNNAAIACHMANFSYFNQCIAVWDADSKRITKA